VTRRIAPAPSPSDLEASVAQVEQCIATLAEALRAQRPQAVEDGAAALQRALATAVGQLRHCARAGELSPGLSRRLAAASARVAAQRDALARATAALDRAIDVLLPEAAPRLAYSARGVAERSVRGGLARA
jgi:hypothetical protein